MVIFKNKITGTIRSFGNITDTPKLYKQTVNDPEWELGTEADLPQEPTFEVDENAQRKSEIKARLHSLSEDMIQHEAGEIVPNYEERKAEFIRLHNELRVLEGKTPRQKQR